VKEEIEKECVIMNLTFVKDNQYNLTNTGIIFYLVIGSRSSLLFHTMYHLTLGGRRRG
jgi:hypothetical protein